MFATRSITKINPILTKRCFSAKGNAAKNKIDESQYVVNLSIPNFCNSQTVFKPFQTYKENLLFWNKNKFNLLIKDKEGCPAFGDHVPKSYRNWYKYGVYFCTALAFYDGAKGEYRSHYHTTVGNLVMSGTGSAIIGFGLFGIIGLWHPVTAPIFFGFYTVGNKQIVNKNYWK